MVTTGECQKRKWYWKGKNKTGLQGFPILHHSWGTRFLLSATNGCHLAVGSRYLDFIPLPHSHGLLYFCTRISSVHGARKQERLCNLVIRTTVLYRYEPEQPECILYIISWGKQPFAKDIQKGADLIKCASPIFTLSVKKLPSCHIQQDNGFEQHVKPKNIIPISRGTNNNTMFLGNAVDYICDKYWAVHILHLPI